MTEAERLYKAAREYPELTEWTVTSEQAIEITNEILKPEAAQITWLKPVGVTEKGFMPVGVGIESIFVEHRRIRIKIKGEELEHSSN